MNAPGEAVRDGKYIYYAYEMHSIRMGIMPYDTKKKKTVRTPAAHLTGTSFYSVSPVKLPRFQQNKLGREFPDTPFRRYSNTANRCIRELSSVRLQYITLAI